MKCFRLATQNTRNPYQMAINSKQCWVVDLGAVKLILKPSFMRREEESIWFYKFHFYSNFINLKNASIVFYFPPTTYEY